METHLEFRMRLRFHLYTNDRMARRAVGWFQDWVVTVRSLSLASHGKKNDTLVPQACYPHQYEAPVNIHHHFLPLTGGAKTQEMTRMKTFLSQCRKSFKIVIITFHFYVIAVLFLSLKEIFRTKFVAMVLLVHMICFCSLYRMIIKPKTSNTLCEQA